MSDSGRLILPDVREWSVGPSGCSAVVGKPSQFPGVVRRLSRMYGSGRLALPDVREWLGVPPECLGPLPDVRE